MPTTINSVTGRQSTVSTAEEAFLTTYNDQAAAALRTIPAGTQAIITDVGFGIAGSVGPVILKVQAGGTTIAQFNAGSGSGKATEMVSLRSPLIITGPSTLGFRVQTPSNSGGPVNLFARVSTVS